MPWARQSHHHNLHELERAALDPLAELRHNVVEIGGDARSEELQVVVNFDYNLIIRGQRLILAPFAIAFLIKPCNLTLDPALHTVIDLFDWLI